MATLCIIDALVSAEARAIHLGFNFIQLSFRKNFIIFSDSLSVLSAIKNKNWKNPFIAQLLIHYNTLMSLGKKIILFWIPSHVGISGNDRADLAAKLALNDRITDMNIPVSDFSPQF